MQPLSLELSSKYIMFMQFVKASLSVLPFYLTLCYTIRENLAVGGIEG